MNRRKFLYHSGGLTLGLGLSSTLVSCSDLISEEDALSLPIDNSGLPFKISLAQWSLHRSYWSAELDPLDFAKTARESFGIEAIEYLNQFYADKANDRKYLGQLKQRAEDQGVRGLLIMIDAEGSLATLNEKNRSKAIQNHHKWVDAAKFLGCHSIRVNAAGKGDRTAVQQAAIDSLGQLCEYASQDEINIIVENHGGYSSDAAWLTEVMRQVNMPNCGTLPDFGNFLINMFPYQTYDKYQGTKELMPFAKGVSAKTYEFNAAGEEKRTDFHRMLKIILDSGFQGHIGIEYEGYKLSERAGILATLHLLQKTGRELT